MKNGRNITKSFGGKFCAFKRGRKKVLKKKTKSFGGKIVLRKKKVCSFEWCLVLSQKYTKSFGGKNLVMRNGFVPSKVKVYVCFLARLCSKSQNFFPFWQPYIVKK